MATIHKCDQCGSLLKRTNSVPVQIGQPHPQAMMMWLQGGESPKNTQDFSSFEFCKECAMQLALALSLTKKAIKNGLPLVRE